MPSRDQAGVRSATGFRSPPSAEVDGKGGRVSRAGAVAAPAIAESQAERKLAASRRR